MEEVEYPYTLDETEPPLANGYVAYKWERAFFNAYLYRYGDVPTSADHAGVSEEMVEQRAREAPQFASNLAFCRRRLIGTLKSEAVRRALEPERKAIVARGRVIGYEDKYDNRLLMWLLERMEPESFHLPSKLEAGTGDGETVFKLELTPGRDTSPPGS